MTKEAFENAITLVMALGGSTNAVLHLSPWPMPPGSS
jgi:dihydroxy-acid dehydratase